MTLHQSFNTTVFMQIITFRSTSSRAQMHWIVQLTNPHFNRNTDICHCTIHLAKQFNTSTETNKYKFTVFNLL